MKAASYLLYALIISLLIGCIDTSSSYDLSDPLSVALKLNDDYKSLVIDNAQSYEEAKIAHAYLKIGQNDKAEKLIKNIDSQYYFTVAMAEKAIHFFRNGKASEAVNIMQNAVDVTRSAEFDTAQTREHTYKVLIRTFGRIEEYELARELVYALELPKSRISALGSLARTAIDQKDVVAARKLLNEGTRIGLAKLDSNPKLASTMEDYVWIYYKAEEQEKAIELIQVLIDYEKKRELKSYEYASFLFTGYFQKLIALEQYDLAIDLKRYVRRKIVSSNSNSILLKSAPDVIDMDIASVHALQGPSGVKKAIRIIRDKDDPEIRFQGYRVSTINLVKKEKYKQAEDFLKLAALEIRRQDNTYQKLSSTFWLIEQYLAMGKKEESLFQLHIARSMLLDSDSPEEDLFSWMRLINSYQKLDEEDVAKQYLRSLLAKVSNDTNVTRREQNISKIAIKFINLGLSDESETLITNLFHPLYKTDALREVIDANLESGNFNKALHYIAQLDHRGTVIQYLRFMAQDMFEQTHTLDENDLLLLKEIANGKYS